MNFDKIPYQRYPETHNVIGFITNVQDAVSFDICLELTEELKMRYADVFTSEFTYIDFPSHTVPHNVSSVETHNRDNTYRCRLRGVGINNNAHKECKHRMLYGKNSYHAAIDVSRMIDRSDGWVICTLSDVDVYRRLLVDIKLNIVTTGEIIDLRNYLLTHSAAYGGMFHIYGSNPPKAVHKAVVSSFYTPQYISASKRGQVEFANG